MAEYIELLTLKFLLYWGWCYIGLWWLLPFRQNRLSQSLLYGLARIVLGFVLAKYLPVIVGWSVIDRAGEEIVRIMFSVAIYAYAWVVIAYFMFAAKEGEPRVSYFWRALWVAGGIPLAALGN